MNDERQFAENVAPPGPSDVDAIEALSYVMAACSGVLHPDLMERLRVVFLYLRPRIDRERTDG